MTIASRFKRLVMLDSEFTSLDPDAALIWDIGVVVVEFPSMAVVAEYSDQCGVPEHQWCRNTLQWARRTYDEDTYKVATTPKPGDRFQARRRFIADLMTFLQEYAAGPDVIVMTNHPEMDLQVLRKNILCSLWNANQARSSNDLFPWNYRNVQDLQSVILGLLSYDDKEFEDCSNTGKSATHRAIDDCHSQIQWLERAMRRRGMSAVRANKWPMVHAMTPNYIEYPDTDFDSEKERMPQIATNGNEGEHYEQEPSHDN